MKTVIEVRIPHMELLNIDGYGERIHLKYRRDKIYNDLKKSGKGYSI